jgi:hypothetical protein
MVNYLSCSGLRGVYNLVVKSIHCCSYYWYFVSPTTKDAHENSAFSSLFMLHICSHQFIYPLSKSCHTVILGCKSAWSSPFCVDLSPPLCHDGMMNLWWLWERSVMSLRNFEQCNKICHQWKFKNQNDVLQWQCSKCHSAAVGTHASHQTMASESSTKATYLQSSIHLSSLKVMSHSHFPL